MAAGGEHPDVEFWRQRVQAWYPHYLRRRYFQPAAFMNRTNYRTEQFAGENVYVAEPPVGNPRRGAPAPFLQSDARDDKAQVKVLHCLQDDFFKDEPMFVISQLDFGDYLNMPVYAAAVQTLPRPIDLKLQNIHRGDFDLLIIHRLYGILACQIKAIGEFALPPDQQDQQIKGRLVKLIKQLQKDGVVLSHIVSDQQPSPRIKKTVMLPNIGTAQLQSVLSSDSQLSKDLCRCLGIKTTEDPIPLCLTSDTLSNPRLWWEKRMTVSGTDSAMTDQLYLDLISRFCGPATTVKVACSTPPRLHLDLRTEDQAVAETGWTFTRLVLHPSQLAVLNSPERLVFMAGPPGCGKSIVLMLKGLDWLRRGKHVLVIGLSYKSLAASHMIHKGLQLLQANDPAAIGTLQLHANPKLAPVNGDSWDVRLLKILKKLAKSTQDEEVIILADEIDVKSSDALKTVLGKVPGSTYIWAGGIIPEHRPDQMIEYILNEPLRSPPNVTREVQQSELISVDRRVPNYSDLLTSPAPSDFFVTEVIDHSGRDHSKGNATDCDVCGRQLAERLHSLRVGTPGDNGQAPVLKFNDVLLLAHVYFVIRTTDSSGVATWAPTALVRALMQAGIPVNVVSKGDESAVAAVACKSGPDHVVAAHYDDVRGLERPVVVYFEGGGSHIWGRLHAPSRCTAKLIWVKSSR